MNAATKQADAAPTEMGVFSTAGAMSLLWQKAVRELHTHELEWFANGAAEQVVIETNSLADVLMRLGELISGDADSGSFGTSDGVANLVWNISNQLSGINGLAQIADSAGYRVRQALKDQQGGANHG